MEKDIFTVWNNVIYTIEKNNINVDEYKYKDKTELLKKNNDLFIKKKFDNNLLFVVFKIRAEDLNLDMENMFKDIFKNKENIYQLEHEKFDKLFMLIIMKNDRIKEDKKNCIKFKKYISKYTKNKIQDINSKISLFKYKDFAINKFKHKDMPNNISISSKEEIFERFPEINSIKVLPKIQYSDPIIKLLFTLNIDDVIHVDDYILSEEYRIVCPDIEKKTKKKVNLKDNDTF